MAPAVGCFRHENLGLGSAMRSGPKAAKRCAEGAGLDGVAERQAIIGLAEGKSD